MVRIKRITVGDALYRQEVDLRERVLLQPIGMTLAEFKGEFPGCEERFEHIVATIAHPQGERVVGCVCLLPDESHQQTGKLMQMAVDPQRQGEGIGRQLVAEFERRAIGELGLETLYCHSRLDARGFYESLGWRVEGGQFDEAGIPHVKMVFKAFS